MKSARLFLNLLRWDIVRELRRKEVVINMTLFAVVVLFIAQLGLGPILSEFQRKPNNFAKALGDTIGPVLFWISVLFAGTVGLNQSLAAEREGSSLVGVQLAPFDLGIFYFAKVAATWLYTFVMQLLLLLAYVVLFNFTQWRELPWVLVVMGLLSLGYIAPGVVLAAMTTTLRAGDVVLRILLFPLFMPLIYFTLRVKEATFGVSAAEEVGIDPITFGEYLVILVAFDAIYLATGLLIFPKVLEE